MTEALLTHVFDSRRQGRTAPASLTLHVADTFWSRLRGLHAFSAAAEDQALLLWPCRAVHTVGLSRPIDVVFVDRHLRVLRVASRLEPRRAAVCRQAHGVIELAAGYCDAHPGFTASLPGLGGKLSAVLAERARRCRGRRAVQAEEG